MVRWDEKNARLGAQSLRDECGNQIEFGKINVNGGKRCSIFLALFAVCMCGCGCLCEKIN